MTGHVLDEITVVIHSDTDDESVRDQVVEALRTAVAALSLPEGVSVDVED